MPFGRQITTELFHYSNRRRLGVGSRGETDNAFARPIPNYSNSCKTKKGLIWAEHTALNVFIKPIYIVHLPAKALAFAKQTPPSINLWETVRCAEEPETDLNYGPSHPSRTTSFTCKKDTPQMHHRQKKQQENEFDFNRNWHLLRYCSLRKSLIKITFDQDEIRIWNKGDNSGLPLRFSSHWTRICNQWTSLILICFKLISFKCFQSYKIIDADGIFHIQNQTCLFC